MKKLLMTAAALVTLATAGTASAQPWRGDSDFGNFDRRQARAERQIERCDGISGREERQLRYELRQVQRLEWNLRRGGFDRYEFVDLERAMDRLERHIRRECNDDNLYNDYRRYDHDRDGIPNRWDRHDRYGDYDRDGIPNWRDRRDRGH